MTQEAVLVGGARNAVATERGKAYLTDTDQRRLARAIALDIRSLDQRDSARSSVYPGDLPIVCVDDVDAAGISCGNPYSTTCSFVGDVVHRYAAAGTARKRNKPDAKIRWARRDTELDSATQREHDNRQHHGQSLIRGKVLIGTATGAWRAFVKNPSESFQHVPFLPR